MADRCIDGTLTTGTQAGTVAGAAPTDGEWANAAHAEANIQAVYDGLAAGDTLHATRTQTLTAPIDIDQAHGTAGNPIAVLGYNYNGGAPIADGSKYVIDANSTAANCILAADKDFWTFKNVEFKNATADNVTGVTDRPQWWQFVNCDSHNAGGAGWGTSGGNYYTNSAFVLCRAYSNGESGFFTADSYHSFCTAYSNGSSSPKAGFNGYRNVYTACVGYSNDHSNFYDPVYRTHLFNCVSDDPVTRGIYVKGSPATVIGSRITGTGTGIVGDGSADVLDLWNYIVCDTAPTAAITVDQQIEGADTRIETGVEGYIDAAGGNYGLTNDAAARRTAVVL